MPPHWWMYVGKFNFCSNLANTSIYTRYNASLETCTENVGGVSVVVGVKRWYGSTLRPSSFNWNTLIRLVFSWTIGAAVAYQMLSFCMVQRCSMNTGTECWVGTTQCIVVFVWFSNMHQTAEMINFMLCCTLLWNMIINYWKFDAAKLH